ncbi:hypothetical protein C1N50_17950 [Vibrio campbellii]|nr:hypothetical protein C1N50_17950 [Vibrio campbellii]
MAISLFCLGFLSRLKYGVVARHERAIEPKTYTQVTSRCRIQSVVIDSRSRKTTPRNSQLFPSCLTQRSGQ